MGHTRKRRKPVSAETIARLADKGSDVSRFYTNNGRMTGPIQRVNVDFASGMLEELDRAAKELNISRQVVIKTLIREALDQQYRARENRPTASGRSETMQPEVPLYTLHLTDRKQQVPPRRRRSGPGRNDKVRRG